MWPSLDDAWSRATSLTPVDDTITLRDGHTSSYAAAGPLPHLGPVDGLHQDHDACEADDGIEARPGPLASQCHALEPLELADRLLDARTESIETLWKKATSLLGVFATRDNRRDAACKRGGTICGAVVSLVGHRDARPDVRTDVERYLEFSTVAGLATGQMEVERVALEIGLKVDLCRESAARATEGLLLLPPFAPAAET